MFKKIMLSKLRNVVRKIFHKTKIFLNKDVMVEVSPLVLSEMPYSEDIIFKLLLLRPDFTSEKIKSILLNEKQYLSDNLDVKLANICPVYHYYNYGIIEGRSFSEPNFKSIDITERLNNGKKVIFFDTHKSNASFLYRGFFPDQKDPNITIIHKDTPFFESINAIFGASELVLIRPSHDSERTKYFINLCKILCVNISLDFDDLLLPDYIHAKGSVRSGVTSYYPMQESLNRDSSLLLTASKITCSTKKIAEVLGDYASDVVIKKNKLPIEYFLDKKAVMDKVFCKNDKVNILYLSGTRTHLKDYSLISAVLISLAQKFPQMFTLNFMGNLNDQTSIFSTLNVECDYIPLLDFDSMIKKIGDYDLVLVPLENTIFNNAKSNIKFIESASQGVPIIASSVDEYKETIQNGRNGWICTDDKEWYETIEKILFNHQLLKEPSINAYEDAVLEYSI